jgi:putative transposase
VVLAAVGIESNGTKHVLGLREGATENAAACKALLADLIERGLDPNRAILVVIDGAKALHKAISETFGARVLIHRCHAGARSSLPQYLQTSFSVLDVARDDRGGRREAFGVFAHEQPSARRRLPSFSQALPIDRSCHFD